jgi:phage portal protein BeeE
MTTRALSLPAHLERRYPEPAIRGEVVHRRDPRAATAQLQYVSPQMVQPPAWDADRAFRFGYIANVIAYRCVQLRANALANVPIVVGPRRGMKRVDPENSPLNRLLGPPPGGPAPKLSARKLIRWTIAQQIVTGRRGWEIETGDGKADGEPVAFWPLASSSLDALPSSSGTEWFRAFRYGRWGDKRQLAPGFVFYGWAPSGTDFRQAESAFQAARYDLSLVSMADRYSISFLMNNATPATVVTTSAFPDADHRDRFRSQWHAEFGGVDNAGRTRFYEADDDGDGPLGEAIDVKVLGLSQKDAQLAEARKESLIEIAIGLGTPWSKLDASGRTFDNAEVEDRSWWEDTNEPDMADLEDDINMQLAPRLGSDVCWFDRSEVRALRRKIIPVTQTVGAPHMVQAQLMWVNEARVDYGLEPIPGGDRMMTAEEIQALKASAGDESIRAALLAIESRGAGGTPPEPTLGGGDDLPQVVPPAPEPEDRGPDQEAIEARKAKIWSAFDKTLTALEKKWERKMAALFIRQAEETDKRLHGKRGRQALRAASDPAPEVDPAKIFDRDYWAARTAEVVADLYESVVQRSGDRLDDTLGFSFDLEAPWVTEFIEARTNMLAGGVTDTTYQAITEQLAEGVAGGESIDDLAARVRSVFETASTQRATVIARTEVISAYNGAAVAGAASLPADVVAGQEYIATRDGRVRAAHAAADGQVRAVGEPFDVGGEALAYPGDPAGAAKNTVNCRCTVAFLTPEEYEKALGARGRMVDHRLARAMLDLIGPDTQMLRWRRALEEVAA